MIWLTLLNLIKRGDSVYPLAENLVLKHMSDLPIGAWFRIDIAGQPGLGIAKKVSKTLGIAGDQAIEIYEPVWWVTNYIPPDDKEVVGEA